MLDCASLFLQHYVPQSRIVLRRSSVCNSEVSACIVAGEKNGDVVDPRWGLVGVWWELELAIRGNIKRDMQRIFGIQYRP